MIYIKETVEKGRSNKRFESYSSDLCFKATETLSTYLDTLGSDFNTHDSDHNFDSRNKEYLLYKISDDCNELYLSTYNNSVSPYEPEYREEEEITKITIDFLSQSDFIDSIHDHYNLKIESLEESIKDVNTEYQELLEEII